MELVRSIPGYCPHRYEKVELRPLPVISMVKEGIALPQPRFGMRMHVYKAGYVLYI